jgi:hypothetical protein
MTVNVLDVRIIPPMTYELVRDRIAEILTAELANQVTLAEAVPVDSTPYKMTVVVEETIPYIISQIKNQPIVNVWYDTGDILTDVSPATNQQQGEHFYNIDVYVSEPSTDDNVNPIEYGDVLTAKEVQERAGIIYQVIMADINTQLQFPRRANNVPVQIVASRQFNQLATFQPTFGDQPLQNIQGFRLRLKVRHNEVPPQILGDALDGFKFTISRRDTTIDIDNDIEIDT